MLYATFENLVVASKDLKLSSMDLLSLHETPQVKAIYEKVWPIIRVSADDEMPEAPENDKLIRVHEDTLKLSRSFPTVKKALAYLKREYERKNTYPGEVNNRDFRAIHDACERAAIFSTLLEKSGDVKYKTDLVVEKENQSSFLKDLPQFGFDWEVYAEILPIIIVASEMESESPEIERITSARNYAAKLAILFGDKEKALEYLKKFIESNPGTKQPIHDACLFSFPTNPEWDITHHWRDLIVAQNPSTPKDLILRLLPRTYAIDKYINDNYEAIRDKVIAEVKSKRQAELFIEYDKSNSIDKSVVSKDRWVKEKLEEEKKSIRAKVDSSPQLKISKNTPLKILTEYNMHTAYDRADENPEAAILFFDHMMDESYFNEYLGLKPQDDVHAIPPITIDGRSIAEQVSFPFLVQHLSR